MDGVARAAVALSCATIASILPVSIMPILISPSCLLKASTQNGFPRAHLISRNAIHKPDKR
jgi:hypothetical protein